MRVQQVVIAATGSGFSIRRTNKTQIDLLSVAKDVCRYSRSKVTAILVMIRAARKQASLLA